MLRFAILFGVAAVASSVTTRSCLDKTSTPEELRHCVRSLVYTTNEFTTAQWTANKATAKEETQFKEVLTKL